MGLYLGLGQNSSKANPMIVDATVNSHLSTWLGARRLKMNPVHLFIFMSYHRFE